ncbi:MAG TPA: YbhB/YbcL family Raf kinase inhibitor-like protein [Verrucomicrobiae bacterium]|nr:YbhB/YbcL family Raf kinase inhibitor-like protein [Verrucomicrobiae bacterium]
MIAAVLLAATLMQLHSGDFVPGGAMPSELMAAQCGGENRSPALAWSGAPQATKSFALIVRDADAPVAGGFYHWVLYDIPAGTQELDGNARLPSSEIGLATTGKAAYYGPCPPPGPAHHYTFTLYALDVEHVGRAAPLDAADLLARIAGHVLAKATLSATASST